MKNMMTMDRSMMTSPMMSPMSMPGMSAMPAMNMMMIPRCMMKMEKCDGGMKMMCTSDDAMAVR